MKFLEASGLDSSRASVFWIFFDAAYALDGLVFFKCLRKASIYGSLEVGERHMAESDR